MSDRKLKEVPPMMRDRVVARIVECSRGASKRSGKNMESWVSEVIEPTEITLDGKTYDLTGHEIRHYLLLEGDNLDQTLEAFQRLELGPVNPDSMDCKAREGFCYEMVLTSSENIVKKPVKNEKGVIEYKEVLDRRNKPISTGWEFAPQNVKELLCKAENQAPAKAVSNSPY